jgi:hypothetical protein
VRFIYRREFEDVLRNAFKLRGKPVSIHEQFPAEIENRRKQLYPVMKQAKRDGKMATMTRGKLSIDGERYVIIRNITSVTICVVQTSRTCMFSSAFLCRRVPRA